MATGIFGGLLFICCSYLIIHGAWKLTGSGTGVAGLTFSLVSVQLFVSTLFSKTLGQSPEVWVVVVLALSMVAKQRSHR
jgi:hypothetical protein